MRSLDVPIFRVNMVQSANMDQKSIHFAADLDNCKQTITYNTSHFLLIKYFIE